MRDRLNHDERLIELALRAARSFQRSSLVRNGTDPSGLQCGEAFVIEIPFTLTRLPGVGSLSVEIKSGTVTVTGTYQAAGQARMRLRDSRDGLYADSAEPARMSDERLLQELHHKFERLARQALRREPSKLRRAQIINTIPRHRSREQGVAHA